MVKENVLTQIAVKLVELWLLLWGFQPAEDWDAADSCCLIDYGPHRVWTVQASMPVDAVTDSSVLMVDLDEFIKQQNLLLNLGFQAYDVTVYETPNGWNIYASIVHTA